MSKILKLINNERKNLIVKTKLAYDDLGCTYIDNVDCSTKDYERCEYAIDICGPIDREACTGGSVDICTEDDRSGCEEKHYDSCRIDISFCSEAEKYDYDTF